ncbi:uncharacterized protein N7473_012498 [Penicillium subrubescens]|uniref:uncharacterized protein n=1 Tax=Penicillium subrubescens TaxID=1316194 RepID=UPI0025454927|nr:uncharacterized protein N7473_012498 [Penicillium subrubescens]KAJ5875151.1 hypothetical protein N7473_012498 [Penicillium subrubescens]
MMYIQLSSVLALCAVLLMAIAAPVEPRDARSDLPPCTPKWNFKPGLPPFFSVNPKGKNERLVVDHRPE